MSCRFQKCHQIQLFIKLQLKKVVLARQNFGADTGSTISCTSSIRAGLCGKDQTGAGPGRTAAFQLRQQAIVLLDTFDHHLHLAAAFLAGKQASRNDPGIVKHQQIIGIQQFGQLSEDPVLQVSGAPVQA